MAPKKASANKKQTPTIPGGDHIVFEDDKKKKRGGKSTEALSKPVDPSEPPKPTARQVIGGASWTGKLPVNLLSEHCQKQKWNKPDYSMRHVPGGEGLHRSSVTLSKTDPKTKETTTIPSFTLPQSHAAIGDASTALEARHFAATYALFRISSMKNIHMMLPPNYRDFWKGDFQVLKKEDEKEGRGWKYDADPFAAEEKRKENQAAIQKRQQDQVKKQEAATANPSLTLPVRASGRGWQQAPKLELGQRMRTEIERLVRKNAIWNAYEIKPSTHQHTHIMKEVTKLGFRKSHVEEALEYCKDQEEVLEWLLIHVPEDDLPPFALPAGYSAGVTLASGDLAKEGKLKRMARAGYSAEVCAQALQDCEGNERAANHNMVFGLVPELENQFSESGSNPGVWEEEMSTLQAILDDKFSLRNAYECVIVLDTTVSLSVSARFACPLHNYPNDVPDIFIEADALPAYIRLSAARKATLYAMESCTGEVMIYNICTWLETNLPDIVEQPGKLRELAINQLEKLPEEDQNSNHRKNKGSTNPRAKGRRGLVEQRSDEKILELWTERQHSRQQINMLNARQRLPAWTKQEDIIQAISSKEVTIVSGETGSGKSTQVVQFILDEAIQSLQGASTNIVCTQPRRVATLSLADRVSNERCSAVGEEVGYIIRGESKISPTTKITFMTTGVLLRRLQTMSSMSEALQGISHIFIDEVHERSLDTDFLLALLRDALKAHLPLKVILMSATLDAEIFSHYFGGLSKVSLVHIEGRTFPVQNYYVDDVLKFTNFKGRASELEEDADTGKAVQALGIGINYDLIQSLIRYIDRELGSQPGSILVFLPGTLEIDRCLRAASAVPNVLALPLHASLLPTEQRKVFPPAPAGKRKVIAATNVAETSITIEDVVAVIDTGKVKETNYDSVSNIVRLEEVWASQAACKQRRGRAGRVRAGICYKLFTRNTESHMASKTLPEILRVPLEQLCLSVKATGEDRDIAKFLAQTLTPPESAAVRNAVRTLHTMGALEDERLTALGTYLSLIPADLRCAKLLVYGALFDCLEPCLSIAAILTVKSPFVSPREQREQAKEARSTFSTAGGDLLVDLAAYEQYIDTIQDMRYKDMQNWCHSKFLSPQTLRDINSTRSQLLDSLRDTGLVALDYRSTQYQQQQHVSTVLLRALISAALQPQIASIALPSKKYMQSHTGAKELDPEARTIKYFIPTINNSSQDSNGPDGSTSDRVFIHPSSILFDAQTFTGSASYLAYFTKMATSKTFIRDLTPVNAYSLLLFGGKIEVDTNGAGLIVGEAFKMRGWARIGVLVSRLRALLDDELRKAIDKPASEFSNSKVVAVVKKLIELNGQDQ